MSNENAKIDDNYKKSLLGVTDNAAAELRRLLIDPDNGRLKVSAVIAGGTGVDSIAKEGETGLTGDVTLSEGTGITLTQTGNDIEITSTAGGAPSDATYIVQTANGSLSAEQALGALATGLLKNTTTTGVLSIAVAGTDYQAVITGGATTILSSDLTADRALISSGAGKVAVSTVTNTELGYVSGVTSSIQTQLNGKQATLTNGIADTNNVVVDSADVADNDYAKFTASGLEGRSYTEVKTDLSLDAVENTALSTWAGSANIVTVGTIGTGTWEGTDVGVQHGGTGASSLTDHGILVGSGTDAITALSVGTNGQLLVGSTGADPVFATVNAGTGLTTTLGAGTFQIDADTASDTAVGVVELATTAETNTGTDATRAVTPDGLADSKFGTSSLVGSINFVIDGGGSAITTGVKGDLVVPFACTINEVTVLADQSGSIVVDIWKDTYANFPPTDADSITASAPPTLSTVDKSQDATLTGWTTSISAGDSLRFNVDSATTVTRVSVLLKVTKS